MRCRLISKSATAICGVKRAFFFFLFLLLSCGEKKYTAQECQSLTSTAVQRCFGGDLRTGKYVGDLKCWPFSKPQRMHGVWAIAMETSVFAPNATKVTSEAPPNLLWLETELLKRPEIIAAGQGAGPLTHAIFLAVLLILALCFVTSMFGVGGQAVRAVFPATITVIICIAVVMVLLRFALNWSKRGDSR